MTTRAGNRKFHGLDRQLRNMRSDKGVVGGVDNWFERRSCENGGFEHLSDRVRDCREKIGDGKGIGRAFWVRG